MQASRLQTVLCLLRGLVQRSLFGFSTWVPTAAMNPRATEKGISERNLSINPNNKNMLCSKSAKMDNKLEKFLNEHFRKYVSFICLLS